MKTNGLFIGALLLASCGSTQTMKVGETLRDSSDKVHVKLEGKGQLFVAQKLRSGSSHCEGLKGLLTVKVRRDGESLPYDVRTSCTYMKSTLVAHTEKDLPKGEYIVEVSRDWDKTKTFVENPSVNAKYLDSDFNSGADFIADGAQAIEPGQVLKGRVSYASGNATDWIRLKGKGTTVNLTYIEDPDAAGLLAQVYDYPAGAKTPRPVFQLRHKQRVSVKLHDDNLLVRIAAKDYLARGEYQLVRADGPKGAGGGDRAASQVKVIDAYPLGDGQSAVLLQKAGAMKVSDLVSVFGKNPAGRNVHLGECQVTSVSESQASCRLDGSTHGFTAYTAELKGAG